MRWSRGRGLDQIQDRRGMRAGPIGVGAGGIGGLGLIVILVINLLGGGGGASGLDPGFGSFQPGLAEEGPPLTETQSGDDLAQFTAFVVDDVQTFWTESFRQAGDTYQQTELVLFEEAVATGCGSASSATGPFYCPADRLVYLDLGFFQELQNRFGAEGDFAHAYVVAHEFGHHVQNIQGTNERVRRAQQSDPDQANALSIALELQADCLAGAWAHSAFADQLLESGDLEEALGAAAAVGDDRIQERTTGRVDPETWNHGSSKDRAKWFGRGYESGNPANCDTFS